MFPEEFEWYKGRFKDKDKPVDVYSRPKEYMAEDIEDRDVVNKPPHYQFKCGLEVLDLIQELLGSEDFEAYCEGNVIKYILRARKKGKYSQDIRKAQVYLNKLIESDGERSESPF